MSASRCLVLGSNSFSGSHFCARLLGQGWSVFGCSRSAESHPAFLPYTWTEYRTAEPERFEFRSVDLNHDLDALMGLIERERVPYVVNFAAQSMVAESWKNPDQWFMTNVVSTVRLHERLRACSFLERYVHVSTPEVYGSTSGSIDEDAPFNPSTPYAVSRAAADMSLRTYFNAYHFPVVFTRAANVFGPGQQLYRIVPRAILFFLTGRKLQLHGGGHSVRSFIHIRDVCDATERIMLAGSAGRAYHISTDRMISIADLVRLICSKLGVAFESCVELVGERLGKDAAYRLDASRVRNELGWRDALSLEQGIDETIAWVRRWLPDLECQPLDYVHKP